MSITYPDPVWHVLIDAGVCARTERVILLVEVILKDGSAWRNANEYPIREFEPSRKLYADTVKVVVSELTKKGVDLGWYETSMTDRLEAAATEALERSSLWKEHHRKGETE